MTFVKSQFFLLKCFLQKCRQIKAIHKKSMEKKFSKKLNRKNSDFNMRFFFEDGENKQTIQNSSAPQNLSKIEPTNFEIVDKFSIFIKTI